MRMANGAQEFLKRRGTRVPPVRLSSRRWLNMAAAIGLLPHAAVHFRGVDPQDGPLIRYTLAPQTLMRV